MPAFDILPQSHFFPLNIQNKLGIHNFSETIPSSKRSSGQVECGVHKTAKTFLLKVPYIPNQSQPEKNYKTVEFLERFFSTKIICCTSNIEFRQPCQKSVYEKTNVFRSRPAQRK